MTATGQTANERFHDKQGRYFKYFTVLAVLLHIIVIFFFAVPPHGADFARAADEMDVIDMPPEIKIPPPPEEIARPATPVIAETPEEVSEEITIAETEMVENQPVPEPEAPAAPEAVPAEVGDRFSFTPYEVRPKCQSGCTPEEILRHVPPILKRAGVECSLTVGIKIDTSGNVTATDLLKSSGNGACDQAAQTWAKTTRWSTAYNRDQAVVVWIAQPVTIQTN